MDVGEWTDPPSVWWDVTSPSGLCSASVVSAAFCWSCCHPSWTSRTPLCWLVRLAVCRSSRGFRRFCFSGRLRPISSRRGFCLADDGVDHAIVSGFGRTHPVVAVDVVCDSLDGLAGVGGHHLLQAGIDANDL